MTKRKRIIAVIPARYGSTRFEGKPLADILGKPMIYYVYQQASKSKIIDEVIVATEDERIKKAVENFGGYAVMTSETHHTGTDRIAEAALNLEADIIVNVQGDEPLVHPVMIEQAVDPVLSGETYVTTLMTKIENPADLIDITVVKLVKDKNNFVMFFSRSPIPYPKTRQSYTLYKQIGLYAFTKEFLLDFYNMEQTPLELIEGVEFLRILENGCRVKGVETEYRSFSVDTISDLFEVRKIIQLQFEVENDEGN